MDFYYYKLIIAYDGTEYQGWQYQKNVNTITNTLLDSFKKIFNKECYIIGASRTDAGVHAMEQVARLQTSLDIDCNKLMFALNNGLPKDITITLIEKTNKLFHPIKKVSEKTYYYHFFIENPLPFTQRYGYYYHHGPIDLGKLQECLNIFIGQHDFRSFSTGNEMNSTIRTINSIDLKFIPELNAYRIIIKGKSFLHHMIRRVVGACLFVASSNNLTKLNLIKALEEKNANQNLPNAPAKGLMLFKIIYCATTNS